MSILKLLVTLLSVALLVLAGCQSVRTRDAIAPSLQLTESAALQLPATCESRGSVLVAFTVLPDGATTGIHTAPVPDCLHDALTAWVASFRYSPPGVIVPSSVEWMLVTARKGS